MIRAVVFDIGEVLVDFDWNGYIRRLFPDEALIERIESAVWKSRLWQEFDRGVLSDEEIINRMIQEAPELSDEIRLAMSRIGETVRLRETTLPWIHSLKRAGYPVLFLSNYSVRLREQNPEALCFLKELDGGIFSYEVHLLKPDPAIYRTLCERYGLVPEETVFLDDNEANVEAAVRFGLHGIRVSSVADAQEKLKKLLTNTR